MKKLAILAAGTAVALTAAPAAAAPLIYAAVTGVTSPAVWDTAQGGYWTLFLQQPFGSTINPTDNFTSDPTEAGGNNFVIGGEGFYPGTSQNSDLTYRLTLQFADGAEITGLYTFGAPGGAFAGGTSSTAGNTTYTMTGFGWDRSRADNVSAYVARSGGDPFDYTGQFSFTAASGAIPEPATWALFILGFGAIGGALRRRSSAVRVSKAKLHFA